MMRSIDVLRWHLADILPHFGIEGLLEKPGLMAPSIAVGRAIVRNQNVFAR